MTIFRHELRRGRMAFMVWTGSVAFLLGVCLLLFPEMKGEMAGVSAIFSSMGSFTQAFGMDRLNFGELIGFYGIECGNVLGLGGAFFAAQTAVNALSGEERDHTAEFLLTHPVSRARVVGEKLCSVAVQILLFNVVVFLLALLLIRLIGEEIPWTELSLIHLAYLFLQWEIAAVCFGLSAFLRRGGAGVGLGLAAMLYFLNLIANIT